MASIPRHKLFESPNSRSIRLEDSQWFITASTNPISNALETDTLHADLGFPLPEMTFGNNHLTLTHRPSGWAYRFDTPHALKTVKKGELQDGDGGVKVGYADEWLKSRNGDPSSLVQKTKPYDWTYTTTYTGHHPSSVVEEETYVDADSQPSTTLVDTPWSPADETNASHSIPMSELTRPDPIIFYAEIPLFEDELHDNGSSSVLVRIRIMPTCIFILSRFTLRVDNVLFRTHDTRMYHSFASSPPTVIRETNGWEAPYDRIKRQLPKRDDLTPLTDPTFIATTLSQMPKESTQVQGAGTSWRGMGKKVEIAVLLPKV